MTGMIGVGGIQWVVLGIVLDGIGLLQGGPSIDVTFGNPVNNVVSGAFGAFVTTIVFGAIMVALADAYTERMMALVVENPVGTFVYGLICLVFVVLVTFVLAITIVGILFALPLAIVSYVVWGIGSAIAFLAIGERLVGREDGWLKPLLVGAGVNGLLALTGIGGLLSFCIGAAGFGAVLRDYLA